MLKKIACLALLAAAASMTGCSSVKLTAPNSQAAESLQSLTAPANKASLYVYRDRNSDFGLFMLELDVNKDAVKVSPGCYTRIDVVPGTINLVANHPDLLGGEQELNVTLAAGDVKVFEYKPIARFMVPGESKLLQRGVDELKNIIQNQKLCAQSIVSL